MMKQLREQVGTFTPDNLFYDTSFPVQTGAVKLAAGQGTLLRGTVVGKNDAGEFIPASETVAADEILTDDVDTGAEVGAAIVAETYISGSFNSNALIVDGDIAGHVAILRTKGIYLKATL